MGHSTFTTQNFIYLHNHNSPLPWPGRKRNGKGASRANPVPPPPPVPLLCSPSVVLLLPSTSPSFTCSSRACSSLLPERKTYQGVMVLSNMANRNASLPGCWWKTAERHERTVPRSKRIPSDLFIAMAGGAGGASYVAFLHPIEALTRQNIPLAATTGNGIVAVRNVSSSLQVRNLYKGVKGPMLESMYSTASLLVINAHVKDIFQMHNGGVELSTAEVVQAGAIAGGINAALPNPFSMNVGMRSNAEVPFTSLMKQALRTHFHKIAWRTATSSVGNGTFFGVAGVSRKYFQGTEAFNGKKAVMASGALGGLAFSLITSSSEAFQARVEQPVSTSVLNQIDRDPKKVSRAVIQVFSRYAHSTMPSLLKGSAGCAVLALSIDTVRTALSF
eukprot:653436-Hanusia_phi.AAC.2